MRSLDHLLTLDKRSFWGPLSDTKGRRIALISTFTVYLIANIGLALNSSFVGLMVLRAIQAAGSAATISIGAGVIGDITTASERGGFIGIFGGIRMLGQSVGPVFGGIITQYLGYQAIFWFLLILGAITITLIIVFLPETLRSIAGNGTQPLGGLHRPLYYRPKPYPTHSIETNLPPKAKITFASIFAPMRFLFEKDVFITLFFGSIVYTVWSMVTSSTTILFEEIFHFNNIQIGLCFLPNGAGCVAGSYLTGYLMNYDYRKTEAEYRETNGLSADTKIEKKVLKDFPIERSRLKNIWWMIIIFVISTAAYGFSLSLDVLAVPLILQFCIAYTATAVFSLNSALIIDLFPGASASATAVNNLMRCLLGALGVAFVQQIIDVLGVSATFAMFAGITALLSPLCIVEWYWGMQWRQERMERLAKKEEQKKANDVEKAESRAVAGNAPA
jgi:MFS family permease